MNEPKSEVVAKPTSSKLAWMGTIIAIMALAMGTIALLASLNHLSTLNQRQRMAKTDLSLLTQQVNTLANTSAKQAALIEIQQQHLQNVVVKNQQKDYDSVLTEASYLVRQAQFTLEFDQNPDLAEQLITAADNRIASLKNPALMPVRQTLTNNLQSLKAVPRVPIDSILLNINALGQQIASLPIVSDDQKKNSIPKVNTQKATGWKYALAASWQQLRQVVVVQYHPQPVNQLILPVNRSYLDIHLQMLLGQASWAVLHHQSTIYQESLKSAITWVNNYYIANAPATHSFLNTLQQLSQIEISPPLPNLSATIEAISSAKVILIAPPAATEK